MKKLGYIIGNKLYLAINSKKTIVDISELLTFSFTQDIRDIEVQKDKGKSGLGSAITGGLLFGPVGAIVGAITGKKDSKSSQNSFLFNVDLILRFHNKKKNKIISLKNGLELSYFYDVGGLFGLRSVDGAKVNSAEYSSAVEKVNLLRIELEEYLSTK